MNLVFPIFLQIRKVSLGEFFRRMGRRNRNVNKFAQRKRDKKEQVIIHLKHIMRVYHKFKFSP